MITRAASWTNGQAARASLGQLEFTFGAMASSGASQLLLGGPSGLAWANGTLWVADSNMIGATASNSVQNNRVVSFSTTEIPSPYADLTTITPPSPFCGLCGFAEVNVLGEPDFVSQGPQTRSSQSLWQPAGVATDGHILAVADTNNNRVLIWTSIPTSIDQPANIVLGQKDFTTVQYLATSASTLLGPEGVWIQNGKFFVADTANNRVLIWNSIPTSNDQPADLVLGQPNFGSSNQPPPGAGGNPTAAANQMFNPISVTSDGTHLFVADLTFNRVLIWNSIPTSMDQPADVVVGQPDMTSTAADNSSALCASNGTNNGTPTYPAECERTLNMPRYALSDGTHLYIADSGNDRVLIFNTIPTSNGAAADNVLGQPDFTSDVVTSATISITSTAIDNTGAVDVIASPQGLAWDGTNLYVSDPYNRRVEVFTPGDTSLPDNSVVNWASEIIRQEGIVTLSIPSGGGIVANDTVTVTIQGTAYTYTIKKNDTLDSIAQALVNQINANGGDPNVTAIFAGTGTGSLYLSSKGTNLAYDSITLAATTSNSLDIGATPSGAYLTAGTAATGAAGMLVEIDGTNLADATTPIVAPQNGANLPTTLGGVQVYMDGYAAPIWSVSSTRVVAQIPYSYTNGTAPTGSTSSESSNDRNSVSIYVLTTHSDGSKTVTNATPIHIAPANPGLFNAPAYSGQPRPWPAVGALHQPGNPTAVVSIDGSITAGNTATVTIANNSYTYTVQSGDTLLSVTQNLINQINSKPDPNVTAALGAAFTRIVLTAIQPGAAGTGISIGGSTSSNASITVTPYTTSTCCNVTPGSAITPSNPAVPGELITLAATGLGLLQDINGNTITSYTAGEPYNGPQPNSAANSVNATMAGQTAEVISAGFAPGSYGMASVQIVVPSSLATNASTPVYIAQNAFISNTATLPVGPAVQVSGLGGPPPASSSPFLIYIDNPKPQTGVSGTITISGWAVDSAAAVTGVSVAVDGVAEATTFPVNRPDVCAAYPSDPGCPNFGWSAALDTTALANGNHTISVTATGADGGQFTISEAITVSNVISGSPTIVYIDNPSAQSTALQGTVNFSGWAINANTSMASVTVSVDNSPIGTATAVSRPDVCASHPGTQGCPNVGWSILVNTGSLTNGSHTLSVTGTAVNGQQLAVARQFTVSNWTNNNSMIIWADVPNPQSGPFNGNVTFAGWAVNSQSPVYGIKVAIDGVPYGNASYGVARPDVCGAYPSSIGCPNVGWNYTLDTTLLADGQHTLTLAALVDSGDVGITQSFTFSVNNLGSGNPMIVYIDNPNSQSGPLSGNVNLQGWSISSNSTISTVQVSVDGVLYGTATPQYRPDVCAAYPSDPGCPTANVGWSYSLNTAMLANGSHTLEVTATTASNHHATGSTAFTVQNSGPGMPMIIYADEPNAQANPYQGIAQFHGWVVDQSAAIAQVKLAIDGVPVGVATGQSRPDVCAAYPGAQGCPNVGWTYTFDTSTIADGTHTLDITAVTTGGSYQTMSTSFVISNWSGTNPMQIYIDNPNGQTGWLQGNVSFSGWAIDADGPISSVSIYVDGVPFGSATYGVSRPDVCAAHPGDAGCPNVGWNFNLNTELLADGLHTLQVVASTPSGLSTAMTQVFGTAN